MTITRKIFLLILVVLLSFIVSGCDQENSQEASNSKNESNQTKPQPQVLVEVFPVTKSEISETIESTGTLVGNESVAITAKVTDQISEIHFSDGQTVSKGDILVKLKSAEQSAELEEAEANLNDSKIILSRLERLGNKIAPASDIDEARARVNANQGRFNALNSRIKDRVIRSPFEGVLGFRRVSPGALVAPGTIITELDDVNFLKLDFEIPETYLSKIKLGNTVKSTSLAWPDTSFFSTVSGIGNRVDPITRTISLRTVIDNKDRNLRPGMLLNVQVATLTRSSIMIPEESLIQNNEDSYVYTVDKDSKAQKTPVSIGGRVKGSIEIISGLNTGDLVVVNGQFNLRPMVNVKVLDQDDKQTAMTLK